MRQWRNRGFWVVVAYPCIVVLLSALGFTNHVVWGVAAFGILPFLMGALAWRRGRSKNGLLWILALVLSVPLTRWPLWLSLQLVKPQMETLAAGGVRPHPNQARDQAEHFDILILGGWTSGSGDEPVQGDWWCGLLRIRSVQTWRSEVFHGETVICYELAMGTVLRLYASPGTRRWEIEDP